MAGPSSITSSVAIVNDTTWSTLVGTWRPGRLELYVDGFSRASSTAAATNTSALFGIYHWGWGFSTSQDFNGDIALIACFASSWTPAMVRRWHADPLASCALERGACAHGQRATRHAPRDRHRRHHLPDGVASLTARMSGCRGDAGMIDWIKTAQGVAAIMAAIFATGSPGGTSACRASCSRPSWRRFTVGATRLPVLDQTLVKRPSARMLRPDAASVPSGGNSGGTARPARASSQLRAGWRQVPAPAPPGPADHDHAAVTMIRPRPSRSSSMWIQFSGSDGHM